MQDEEHHAHLLPREANRLPSVEGRKGREPGQRQPGPLGHVSAGLGPKEERLIEGLQVSLRADLGCRLKELSAGGALEVRAPEADGRPRPAAGATLPSAVPSALRGGAGEVACQDLRHMSPGKSVEMAALTLHHAYVRFTAGPCRHRPVVG